MTQPHEPRRCWIRRIATSRHRYLVAAQLQMHIYDAVRSSRKTLFSRIANTTMAIPAVALDEAECGDVLACKDEHTGMRFAGCNMWRPTMYQGDPTPPTTPLLDPADVGKPAPLCGGGTTADTHMTPSNPVQKLYYQNHCFPTPQWPYLW